MFRHVFIAAVKEGVTPEKIQEIVRDLKALRKTFSPVQTGENLGWFNPLTQITLTADFEDKAAFEKFLNSPEHNNIVKNYLDCYKPDMIFTSQFELDE